MRRAVWLRLDSAAARVDTIVATPASLQLLVGDSVAFFPAFRIEARDSAGAPVSGFAPYFKAEPRHLALLRRNGYLIALAPGTAELAIRAVRSNPAAANSSSVPTTRIPIVIKEP